MSVDAPSLSDVSVSPDASGDAEFPYKAISRGAIASVIFFVASLPGLIPTFSVLLAMTLPAILTGWVGLRATRRYPNEFSGAGLAKLGMGAAGALLVCGVALHTYIYLTEVPDGYERVQFYELQTAETAADAPTQKAVEIDGDAVFLKGYIHPSSGSGMLRQFILVPDLGTCCFGGQPRSCDMIEVTLGGGEAVKAGLTKRKLAGTFQLNRIPQSKTDFDNAIFYRMRVDQIK